MFCCSIWFECESLWASIGDRPKRKQHIHSSHNFLRSRHPPSPMPTTDHRPRHPSRLSQIRRNHHRTLQSAQLQRNLRHTTLPPQHCNNKFAKYRKFQSFNFVFFCNSFYHKTATNPFGMAILVQ